jgi:hypothetical protein
VYLVFSAPPSGVSDQEFSASYERHASEVLAIPGFRAARRYWLSPGVPDRPPVPFRHLALYVLDGSPDMGPTELIRRRQEDGMSTEPWCDDIRVETFVGRPLEDAEVELADHGYLVLSHAPGRFTTEEYYGWYYAHARENLTAHGFDAVWRFALTAHIPDAAAPSPATHVAFYQVHGELPELRRALEESFRAGRVDIPDWMPEGEFVSYDCLAVSPARSVK